MKAARGGMGAIPYLVRDISRCQIALPSDEERGLIARAKAGDTVARNRVVEAVLPFCLRQARKYYRTRMAARYELEDCFQWATLGIIRAIERFDPGRGVRFLTYASYFSLQSIRYHGIRARSVIRAPSHADAMAGEGNEQYAAMLECALTTSSLDECDPGGRRMFDVPDTRTPAPDAATLDGERDDEAAGRLAWLKRQLDTMPPREADIIRQRLSGKTFDDVASALGVSKERVRQIEGRAMRRLSRAAGGPSQPVSLAKAIGPAGGNGWDRRRGIVAR